VPLDQRPAPSVLDGCKWQQRQPSGAAQRPHGDRLPLGALEAGHVEIACLVTAHSPTLKEIRAVAARTRATLVEYLVTDKQLLAWVVSPDGAIHGTTVDATRAHLDSLVTARPGVLNGKIGYTYEAVATDRGEPGRSRDTFSIVIRDAAGAVVAVADGPLSGGNIQSTRLLQ
jgi:hypothetical protein